MPAAKNIHNELFKDGFELHLGGFQRFQARRRYVGVMYDADIRERLKFTVGEAGWGSLLAGEAKLNPTAILQIYPTEFEEPGRQPDAEVTNSSAWYIALSVPNRKKVYGFERPLQSGAAEQMLKALRRSTAHKDHIDGALFYSKRQSSYVTKNPYASSYWDLKSGLFIEEKTRRMRFPQWPEFIKEQTFGDGQEILYPPMRLPADPVIDRDRAINELALLSPTVTGDEIASYWDEAQPRFSSAVRIEDRISYVKGRIDAAMGNVGPRVGYPSYVTRAYGYGDPGFVPVPAPPTYDEPSWRNIPNGFRWVGSNGEIYEGRWRGIQKVGQPIPEVKLPEVKSKNGRLIRLAEEAEEKGE